MQCNARSLWACLYKFRVDSTNVTNIPSSFVVVSYTFFNSFLWKNCFSISAMKFFSTCCGGSSFCPKSGEGFFLNFGWAVNSRTPLDGGCGGHLESFRFSVVTSLQNLIVFYLFFVSFVLFLKYKNWQWLFLNVNRLTQKCTDLLLLLILRSTFARIIL